MTADASSFGLAQSVHWREVAGEIVVLDLAAESYHSLNESAARLFVALADGTDHEGLISTLTSTYGIDRADAANDVADFLMSMRQRGWLSES